MPLELVRNDITRMKVDAIVNAANSSLMGGGGVDGAIHRAAGPELLEECRGLGGCAVGHAKITRGYRLPCRYVIHTVGPIWEGGTHGEPELLASCYRSSLELAAQYGCASVAFPLISTGAYMYPRRQALDIATGTIRDYLYDHDDMTVYLVLFDSASFTIGRERYSDIQAYISDAYIPSDYEDRENQRRRLNQLSWDYGVQGIPDAMPAQAAPEAAHEKPCAAPAPPSPVTAPPPAKKQSLWERLPHRKVSEDTAANEELVDYLKQIDESFRDMLLRLIDERGITDAACYKNANIDRKLFNKIKLQPNYHPSKTTVLALALSLKLPMDQMQEMLGKAGYTLSKSSIGDLIVEYHVENGHYDVFEINEALFAFDQKLLGSAL